MFDKKLEEVCYGDRLYKESVFIRQAIAKLKLETEVDWVKHLTLEIELYKTLLQHAEESLNRIVIGESI